MAKAGQGGREAGKKNVLVFSLKSFSSQRKRTEVHFSPPILTRTKLKTYYKDTEGQKGLIGFISVRFLKYAYIGIHMYVHIYVFVYIQTRISQFCLLKGPRSKDISCTQGTERQHFCL